MRLLIIACLLASCGDSEVIPDAAVMPDVPLLDGDFSCLDMARPSTATDPLKVQGQVTHAGSAIAGVSVEIRSSVDDALLGQATSSARDLTLGSYSVEIVTGGVAPSIYRKLVHDRFVDIYDYDPMPVSAMYKLSTELQSPEDVDSYYQSLGLVRDPAKGSVWLEVYDCISPSLGGHRVTGATIESSSGVIAYLDENGLPAPDRTSGSEYGAVIFNVDPGTLDVVVHAGPVTYRSWPVVVHPGAFTYSHRHP